MSKPFLLVLTTALFLSSCSTGTPTKTAATVCPPLDLNPDYSAPAPELGLPCGSFGTMDASTGIATYYFASKDPSNTAYDKEYIIDNGKLLATIDLNHDEQLILAVAHPDLLYFIRWNAEQHSAGYPGTYYSVDRKDGAISAGEVQGEYWASTSDKKEAIFTQIGMAPDEKAVDVLIFDPSAAGGAESYFLPDSTADSGWFFPSALSVSADGNSIALVAQDQIKEKADDSKYYGILFLIDRSKKTVTNVGPVTQTPQDGPSLPFFDGVFTWNGAQVTFTIEGQSVTSNN